MSLFVPTAKPRKSPLFIGFPLIFRHFARFYFVTPEGLFGVEEVVKFYLVMDLGVKRG